MYRHSWASHSTGMRVEPIGVWFSYDSAATGLSIQGIVAMNSRHVLMNWCKDDASVSSLGALHATTNLVWFTNCRCWIVKLKCTCFNTSSIHPSHAHHNIPWCMKGVACKTILIISYGLHTDVTWCVHFLSYALLSQLTISVMKKSSYSILNLRQTKR